jgi:hypothetical protein
MVVSKGFHSYFLLFRKDISVDRAEFRIGNSSAQISDRDFEKITVKNSYTRNDSVAELSSAIQTGFRKMGNWFIVILTIGIAVSASVRAEVYEKEERIYFEKKDESSEFMRPFSTDGCTMYGEGTCRKPYAWVHCCIQHDYKYWHGGTLEEKQEADQELSRCVGESGFTDHGFLMLLGINLFASHTDRWGSGWHQNPGYRALTGEEIEEYQKISPDSIQLNEMTQKLIEMRSYQNPGAKLYCDRTGMGEPDQLGNDFFGSAGGGD